MCIYEHYQSYNMSDNILSFPSDDIRILMRTRTPFSRVSIISNEIL